MAIMDVESHSFLYEGSALSASLIPMMVSIESIFYSYEGRH